jgi:hypothetical protein
MPDTQDFLNHDIHKIQNPESRNQFPGIGKELPLVDFTRVLL